MQDEKIFAMMLAAVMIFTFTACGAESTSETEKEITDVAVYKDTRADILDAEFFTAEDGTSAVRVNFKYTNNSADGLYMYESFAAHAFQNDAEPNDITDINEDPRVSNSAELIREVKDGASLEGSYVFALTDESNVEVRVCTPTADEKLLAQKVFSKAFVMKATITEIQDETMIVKPVDGSWELSSSDSFSIPMQNMEPSPEPVAGDTVEITYNGEIMETYPAQLGGITQVVVIR